MPWRSLFALIAAALLAAPAGAQDARPEVPPRLSELWKTFQQADEDLLRSFAAVDAVRLARQEGFVDDRVRAMEAHLLEAARQVVELRIPSPFRYDQSGRVMPMDGQATEDAVSDELRAWASSARMDLDEAVGKAFYLQPMALHALDVFGDDPRALAILREALTLDNQLAMSAAAIQLAILDDVASLDAIIARADSVPTEAAEALAMMALLEYDHPKALAKATEILGKERVQELLSARQQRE